jgi:hypothetical protein
MNVPGSLEFEFGKASDYFHFQMLVDEDYIDQEADASLHLRMLPKHRSPDARYTVPRSSQNSRVLRTFEVLRVKDARRIARSGIKFAVKTARRTPGVPEKTRKARLVWPCQHSALPKFGASLP